MRGTHASKRIIQNSKPGRSRTNPGQQVPTTLPALVPAESLPPSPPAASPDSPPATPLAFTIPAAWRDLCRRTGTGTSLSTFYLWTRQGRVDTIRVGGRVFILREELERLVEMAFSGEKW